MGGSGPERPWMKVPVREYQAVWREVAEAWDLARRSEAEADLLRPRLEAEVYDRLAARAATGARLESEFLKAHGRQMTAREREIYRKVSVAGGAAAGAQERVRNARQVWVSGVMEKIRRKQEGNPRRLQAVWAEVVGVEAAAQTTLESYDAARGVAYCTSLNPVAAYGLRRRAGLAEKLSEALGARIMRVVFR